ncbi:MAG: DUF6249 domain-containing protein [Betaproteobacteria bacterium]
MDYGIMLLATMSIILGIGAPIALTALVLWHKSRNTRLMHETAALLVEKGQPVPPELFAMADDTFSDLRRGVILIALGLGLGLFMYQMDKPWSLGFIPLFMGVGYLIVWKLESAREAATGRNAA